jgi:hypothetical protein
VLVTPPGGQTSTLTGAQVVPVGSRVDAAHGVVRLTAAAAKGGSYSGLFTKGAFQALQSTSNVTTEIRLGGACTSASAARVRHHASVVRELQITAPPQFLVVGSSAFATSAAGVAKYDLTDPCQASAAAGSGTRAPTRVSDRSGHVVASSKNGRLQRTITAGGVDQIICSSGGGWCVALDVETKGDLRSDFFPAVATEQLAGTFEYCLRSPSGSQTCSPVTSNAPCFAQGSRLPGGGAILICHAAQPGNYAGIWLWHGAALGAPMTFHIATKTPGLPCYGLLGNIDNQPLQIKLGADTKVVTRLTLPFGVRIGALSVALAPTGVAGREVVRGVIYADQNGAPGQLLEVTDPFVFSSNMPADTSYQLEFPAVPGCSQYFCRYLPAGTYWIGVISGGTDYVASIGYDHLAGSGVYDGNAYTAGPSNPFGPFTTEDYYLAVDSDYVPATG